MGYFNRPPKNPEMERDEDGNNILTKEYVIAVCEFNGQYRTPKANTQLYLHYKGKRLIISWLLTINSDQRYGA